jgi:hypothetical protein
MALLESANIFANGSGLEALLVSQPEKRVKTTARKSSRFIGTSEDPSID